MDWCHFKQAEYSLLKNKSGRESFGRGGDSVATTCTSGPTKVFLPFRCHFEARRHTPEEGSAKAGCIRNGTRDLDRVANARAMPDAYTGPKRGH
ncbi:hypothetical protein TNCV_2709611 [Trichonephila clavipes]|nr:hypothetical protein TNCV_2709611 [Trichonephila clavipes]